MRLPLANNSDKEILTSVAKTVSGLEFESFALGVSCRDSDLKQKIRSPVESFLLKRANKKTADYDLYVLLNLERGFAEAIPSSVFIEGYYNKYSRGIAQTFHYCFNCRGHGCRKCSFSGKISAKSVQELLEQVMLHAFGSKSSKFHGAGREDVDVKVLGKGRPFVFELIEPIRRSVDLPKLEYEINSRFKGQISVHTLNYSSRMRVTELKNSELEKVYAAKCFCSKPVSQGELRVIENKSFEIMQFTPVRVEKRRPKKERQKKAKILKAQQLSSLEFLLEILSSHGLYVKEFVSGDDDRTKPSVSSLLGKDCMCSELDVIEIREGESGHNHSSTSTMPVSVTR